MPVIIACPQCRHQLRVDEAFFGRQVRCPMCREVFQAENPQADEPALAVPVEEQEEGDSEQEAEGRRRRLAPGWRTVRSAVALIYTGIMIAFISVIAAIALGVPLAVMGGGPIAVIVFILGALGALGGVVVVFIGECMCCGAPGESGARGFAIGAIVCLVLGVVLAFGSGIEAALAKRPAAGGPMQQGQSLLATLANISLATHQTLFLLFLRTVARCFHNRNLEQIVMRYLALVVGVAAGQFVLNIVLKLLKDNLQGNAALVIAIAIGLTALVLGIMMFLWYLDILKRTRLMIDKAFGDA